MRRLRIALAVAAALACGGRKRYWVGSVTCGCIQVDGGNIAGSYQAIDVCAADDPGCAPIPGKCAQMLADAGCSGPPIESACIYDPGWDYCDPYAPG